MTIGYSKTPRLLAWVASQWLQLHSYGAFMQLQFMIQMGVSVTVVLLKIHGCGINRKYKIVKYKA